VKIIYDASSLINLANGGVLERIISGTNSVSLVGPQVLAECSSIKSELDLLIESHELLLMSDEELPAETYFEILEKFRLGPGETECIAFARQYPDISAISCDDRRARIVCSEVIGESRLTGTIGRLKFAIENNLLSIGDATNAYQNMVLSGGFLPKLNPFLFSNSKAKFAAF
jgi:predicted nucleic acid-binding protein